MKVNNYKKNVKFENDIILIDYSYIDNDSNN